MSEVVRPAGIYILATIYACAVHPSAEPEDVSATEAIEAIEVEDRPQEINTTALKHFLDGELLMMQGNYPMAILEFQDALEYDSSSPAILTSLATGYMRLGKFKNAEKHLKEAISIDPKYQDARELLGHQYLIRNQLDKAEQQYRFLRDFYPEVTQYEYVLAEIALREGKIEEAQNQFWKIYENNAFEVEALEKAADIAVQRKDFKFAFEAYELLIKADPSNAQYWQTYSELAVMTQQFTKAILGLEHLLELRGDNLQIRERLASLYYDSGDLAKADSIFGELYEEGHRSEGVLYYLGRIALDNGDYESLASYSSEFVQEYPDELAGYTNLALAYINLDETLEAISVLLKAREKFPEDFSVNFLLGNSYSLQENYVLAKSSLLTALQVSPDSRAAKHLLATVYNQLEEWNSVDQLYEELLETDGGDSQALNNYSYSLAERGIKLEEALEMALKAISLEPENAAYLDTIGWIYYRTGDYEKALQYIQRSIEREQDNAVVLEHLGDVLLRLDRKAEALDYYRRALELDADNEQLRNKLAE